MISKGQEHPRERRFLLGIRSLESKPMHGEINGSLHFISVEVDQGGVISEQHSLDIFVYLREVMQVVHLDRESIKQRCKQRRYGLAPEVCSIFLIYSGILLNSAIF